MNTKSYMVDEPDLTGIKREIYELLEKADSVTEESTYNELLEAYHNHGIVLGHIRNSRDLKLLPEPEYSRLLLRQLRVGERIKVLLDAKRKEGET